jgi:hypothetical protein
VVLFVCLKILRGIEELRVGTPEVTVAEPTEKVTVFLMVMDPLETVYSAAGVDPLPGNLVVVLYSVTPS